MAELGTSANVTAQGHLGTTANVTAQGHLGTAANVVAQGHLGTSANVTAMGNLGTSANVTNMANLSPQAVRDDMAALGTSAVRADMDALAATAVLADMSALGDAAVITDLDLLGTTANITAMGHLGTSANVTAMGHLGTSANVTAQGHLGTSANVTAMGELGTSANVTAMGHLGTSGNVTAMGNLGTTQNVTNMSNLGTSANISNMTTLAPIAGDITTTAGVSTAVTAYSKQYSAGSGDISTRADGTGTVVEGDLRFRTDTDTMRVYNGTAWEDAAPGAGNYYTKSDSDTRYAQVSNNLSDVTATTARTNLGLDPLLAAKAPLANAALTGSATLNGVAIATGTSDPTLGTLTQAFTAGQQTTINLSSNALSPNVSVTKEVPQSGVTNNQWNVDSAGSGNYTRYNSATATTLSFDVSLASSSYSGKSISVAAKENAVRGIAFNTTATRMYVCGEQFDKIFAYALSTAGDVSTATYLAEFSHSSQETDASGLTFSPDGTKMYLVGTVNSTVFQYTLTTAFDITTASYASKSFAVTSQTQYPQAVRFKTDGTKMFVLQTNLTRSVYQYSLSTAFDVSTASYDTVSFSFSSKEGSPTAMEFSPDGKQFFVAGTTNDTIYRYNLGTAWDVSTLSDASDSLSVSTQGNPQGLFFDFTGARIYVIGSTNDDVFQYDLAYKMALGSGSFASSDLGKSIEANSGKFTLTNVNGTFVVVTAPANYNQVASGSWQMYGLAFNTADTDLEISNITTSTYDLTTASYIHNQGLSSFGSISQPQGISFSATGHKLYVYCSSQQKFFEFDLATNYDVRTLSLRANFSTASNFSEGMDLAISTDGTKMFVVAKQFGRCYKYDLSTAFDITTCNNFALVRNLASGAENETTPSGICFSADGEHMYITGLDNQKVYQYAMTTGFDHSTLSFVAGTTVNNSPHAITLKPDGSVFYIFSQGQNAVRFYTSTTNFVFSSVSYTNQFGTGVISNGTGLQFNGDGSQLNIVDSNNDFINVFSVGTLTHATGYLAAHTTTSVDSTTWTDINGMTATESAGTGTVNYAVSTDDRTTWKIAHNTNGVRNIVKNASGTWQYNSNATYASETWVNGTTNNELATLQQAMEGAVFATNAYNTNNLAAGYDSNSWNVGINPQEVKFTPDGNTVFIMSDSQNRIKSYATSAPFVVGPSNPTNNGSFDYSSQTTSEQGFCFADSGTKLYIIGVNSGTFCWQYSLSTAYDLSTVSYVRAKNIDSVTGQPRGIAFKPDGSKMFITDQDNTGAVYEWALTTNFDISTASNTANFSVNTQTSNPRGLHISDDGTKFVVYGADDDKMRVYTMATPYDITSSSLTMSTDISAYISSGNISGFTFNPSGTILIISDYTLSGGRITRFVLGTTTFTNQMNKAQLDAVSDANQFAVSNDLDLGIILKLQSGTGVPSSDGVSINYDANVANQGAILGTDYNYDVPALNKVRITAVNASTLKVRVV
jgi:sugar lactone lactonase YvrE